MSYIGFEIVSNVLVSVLICLPQTAQYEYPRHPDENLSITQVIAKYGYPIERHAIVTEDGYILTTFRIPHGKGFKKPNDKVIFLVHGLGGSAENFVTLGPDYALAFMLADRGFDVWLFNARGTLHSRKHKFLNPNYLQAATFWNFSWNEIGVYDLPANIDYILRRTKRSKLFYVGHSQGTTSYFVMMSEKPEYNDKIQFAIMLAPTVMMSSIENIIGRVISNYHRLLERLADLFGYYELMIPYSPTFNLLLKRLCVMSEEFIDACSYLYYLVGGQESGLFNKSLVPLLTDYTPSGFAIRQMLHYLQEIKSGYFRKYDYGVRGNLKKYKQKVPPHYKLNNSQAPVALFYANGDGLSSFSEKDKLPKLISNVFTVYEIPYDKFNHLDYIFANKAKELVYEPLYQFIQNFVDK